MFGNRGIVSSLPKRIAVAQIHPKHHGFTPHILPHYPMGTLAADFPGKIDGSPLNRCIPNATNGICTHKVFGHLGIDGAVGLKDCGKIPPPSIRKLIRKGEFNSPRLRCSAETAYPCQLVRTKKCGPEISQYVID